MVRLFSAFFVDDNRVEVGDLFFAYLVQSLRDTLNSRPALFLGQFALSAGRLTVRKK
jgi:hypothetical protein